MTEIVIKKNLWVLFLALFSLNCAHTQKQHYFDDLAEAVKHPDEVKVLVLRERGLRVFPSEILQMKNIEHLDLSFNEFTEIPEEISQLQKLMFLRIGHGYVRKIPRSIGNLKHLVELNLLYNFVEEIPTEVAELPSLTILNLCGNALKTVPLELCKLQNLGTLCLGREDEKPIMSEADQNSLKQCLPHCTITF